MAHGLQQAAASPRPAAPIASTDQSYAALVKMHELGILTKEEVRAMVFEKLQKARKNEERQVVAVPKCKRQVIKPAELPKTPPVPALPKIKNTTKPVKAGLKKRKPANTQKKKLRNIIKNTTRRRFFAECCKVDSILWTFTPRGKPIMRVILFERAASQVIDLLYAESPGALRAMPEDELTEEIRWQVMRDRNNYKGKKPIRSPFTGEALPFNFARVHAEIKIELDRAIDVDAETENAPRVDAKPKREPKVEPKHEPKAMAAAEPNRVTKAEGKAFFAKLYKPCLSCHERLWIGRPASAPVDQKVAHPLGTNWQEQVNGEPYCEKCWKEEDKLLDAMTNDHRCIGKKKRKTALEDKVIEDNANAGEQPPKRKRTKRKPRKKRKDAKKKIEAPPEENKAPPEENKAPPKAIEAPPEENKAPPKAIEAPPEENKAPPKQMTHTKWKVGTSLHQCFSTLPH